MAEHPFHPLSFELQKSAPQSRDTFHDLWGDYAGITGEPIERKLFSEWPIIASQRLQDQLTQRVLALCYTLRPHLQASVMQAQDWQHGGAADILTIDYALIKKDGDDDDWDLRLVEFQSFTSLLAMGYRLQQVHCELWPQLADCPPWQKVDSEQEWLSASKGWMAGGENPALLEYQPWQRGTTFDLHATAKLWKLPIIEPHQVEIDARGNFFSMRDGVRTQHDKILNRLILRELDDGGRFARELQRAKLDWHSHPAWYFLVNKGSAAKVKIPFEPENVNLLDWRKLNLPASDLVAKHSFSYAGKDLRMSPSASELEQLIAEGQGKQWIVQPRFQPYAVAHSKSGEPIHAEFRMVVQLDAQLQPWIAMQIMRFYYGTSASGCYFQGREGEGGTILHRPPQSKRECQSSSQPPVH